MTQLPGCLESLAAQTVGRMEIVIVDDGSVDGSAVVAQRFAEQHGNVCLVKQEHLGTGAARNAGVRHASGTFLAFCDSDDEVPPGAYDRLVDALTSSGSDIAVGSVALQEKGLFREPSWARRSNSDRRLGVGLADVPDTVANLLPGTRVFRRSFWDEANLCFSEGDDHGDAVTMVRALLVARRLDVVPAVVYRWRRREDGRSLLQRDLREPDRARTRLAELVDAVDLMLEQGAEPVQEQFLSDVLHTKARDLIRAAVCQGDSYWSAVQGEMRRLMRRVPESTLERVPVQDRIVAWLCANDERSATEEFLEYAFDNKNGFPFREVDGRPHIALPFVDTLATVEGAMTRVADSDMHYRSRLTHLAWTSPSVLTVEGGAFIEYVDDTEPGVVTLVLRERSTGETVTVPTVQLHQPTVNRWAGRANEDHANAAFGAEIDVASLPRTEGTRATYDISVRLELRGHSREAAFDSRRRGGSPGLLEKSDHDGLSARPVWHAIRGLGIQLRDASEEPAEAAEAPAASSPVTVADVTASGDVLELEGDATAAFEICLVGPRSRTPWVGAQRDGSAFSARISTLVDEWGLGSTSLPTDDYEVVARLADGSETPVHVAPALWRNLPVHVDSGP
ncbi:MAG: glycosyltransferase family 2 protein, partial [Nocardioidaceae bacterium]